MFKRVAAVVAMAVAGWVMVAAVLPGVSPVTVSLSQAQGPPPAFRIVDVRAEYGQMVVEVQHFLPDGGHAYFELYTFQGRENTKHPKVVNADGFVLLKTGEIAPFRATRFGLRQYEPEGREFARESFPHLEDDSLLRVIQKIHGLRDPETWPKGELRLTTAPLNGTLEDYANADQLSQRFQGLINQSYRVVRGAVQEAGVMAPTTIPKGGEFGSVSTFFPDGSPESTSVDGDVTYVDAAGQDWSTIHAQATGTDSDDSAAVIDIKVGADTTTDKWDSLIRGAILFDTSALGDDDQISAATVDFVIPVGQFQNDFSSSVSFGISNPASSTAILTGDFDAFTDTAQATAITLASLTVDDATFNTMTLNSTGRGNISLTSISKFSFKISDDFDDVEPTWASGEFSRLGIASADEALSGDKRPFLTVTHITPSAAITGTVGDGATEQEVRDGAGTIIITLTNDTWVAAGGTFDAQRQAIINGLDAAESETNGWNAQVRDQMDPAAVVRTNSTVATITVSAAAVANYFINANEVITTTVPNAALVTGSVDITAAPTTTITAATESVAITGTLGGSGGTPAEIVAGGQTVIMTLTNTKWAITADFDAQRQGILDGLTSNLSDQNGWDSLAFAVGDVARTSDTVATVSLSAESTYAIPATETITTVVPASAMVHGVALTAAETFAITPSFQSSGTRVSAAIDLSSVTDVAYCAIGWESTVPTNTTVAIATSVDGGTTFSEATNGNCPTGISVGASLASITDFRTRVTLTTTTVTGTPLITALALIIEDTSGQELYYQLNTTPSATLTDRSSQSHTGTMSFPVAPSGISNSADPLESTEPVLTTQQALRSQEVTSEVSGAATSPNIFSQEAGFEGLPGQGIVNAISGAGDGLPKRFVWFIFLGLFTIGIGMVVLMLTGELLIAAVAMAVAMGIEGAIGGGLLPLWTLYTYIPMVATYLLFRRGFPI